MPTLTSLASPIPNPTVQFTSDAAISITDRRVTVVSKTSLTASLSSRDSSTAVETARAVATNAAEDDATSSPHQPSSAIVFGTIGAAVALLCIAVTAWVVVRKIRPKSDKSSSIELQSGPDAAVPSTSSAGQPGSVADQYQSISAASGRAPVEYGQRPVGQRADHYEELSAVASNASGSGRQSTDTIVFDVSGSQQRQTGAGVPSDEELLKRGYSAISAVQRKQYGQRPFVKNDDHYGELAEL